VIAPEGAELGRALRLEVPITFSPEPLDGIGQAAAVIVEPVRKLRTTHWDTAELRLARWGVSLEYSADPGWVLRLPPTGEGMAAPDGAELHFDGSRISPRIRRCSSCACTHATRRSNWSPVWSR